MSSPNAPRLWILIALSALAILPINMFLPSLPGMAKDFGVDFALVNASIAVYAMATAFTHLVAGALSDRFGRKPVAMGALIIFTLASIGCSLATDIRTFLVFRMLQGAVIAGYAVSLAAIRDTADERTATGRIGYVSSAWAVAPMIGPSVGGLLDVHFGWRANFVLFAILGAAGLGLVVCCLRETNIHRSKSFAMQVRGYGQLAQSTRFWAYALCMAFAIGTLYTFLGGAPLVAEQLGGTSGAALGMYMGLVPAGFMAGSYVVGRVSAWCTPIQLILVGRVLTCLGLVVGLVFASLGFTHPLAFFGPCVCVGLGNGLTMPAANARVLSVKPGLAGTASGLAAAVTLVGAGAIAFLSGLLVTASNAHIAVLCVMLASSVASFFAAIFIAAADKTQA